MSFATNKSKVWNLLAWVQCSVFAEPILGAFAEALVALLKQCNEVGDQQSQQIVLKSQQLTFLASDTSRCPGVLCGSH